MAHTFKISNKKQEVYIISEMKTEVKWDCDLKLEILHLQIYILGFGYFNLNITEAIFSLIILKVWM